MKKLVLLLLVVLAVTILFASCGKSNCKHDNPTEIVVVKGKTATCQETGLTEGMMCNLCGTMVVPQVIAETSKCTESDWIVDIESTHTEDGREHTECTTCGKLVNQNVIPSRNKKLEYTLLDDETYAVTGIGVCNDTEIVIPAEYMGLPVVSIGEGAFALCKSITSITIPDSVTSIGEYAFNQCNSLTNIIIPDSVTSIGFCAFYLCTSLTNVTVGDFVTSIDRYAFQGCSSLQNVILGDSVKSIGKHAFSGCDALKSIDVSDNNEQYTSIDGNLYSKNKEILIKYAVGKQDVSLIIPNYVTIIGEFAFSECTSLTSIIIPNSVTRIGERAFQGCSSLQSVVLGDSVKSIGEHAFSGCDALKSIDVSDNNEQYTSIDGNLYSKNKEILIKYAVGKQDVSLAIPNYVTIIGEFAFSECTSLTSIIIPDSVTSIGESAFSGCVSLTSIIIPDSVTSIGQLTFFRCNSITIYCKMESKPIGWVDTWDYQDYDWSSGKDIYCHVVWKYKG